MITHKTRKSKRYKISIYLIDTPLDNENYLTKEEILGELEGIDLASGIVIEDHKKIEEEVDIITRITRITKFFGIDIVK